MRNAFVDSVLGLCGERQDIFIVSGDAGFGVFDAFKEAHPDRFVNMGVAEQNMIGFAAGMAMAGFKVYVYNIVPFVLYRCYEQVRNDICYQELPVVLVGIGSGVTYAPQGMTHYSVEDIGLARTMPNLTVFSPIDPVEARLAALHSADARGPVYVRLAKRGEPAIHRNDGFDVTGPVILEEGKDVAVLVHGSVGIEAVKAAEMLKERGVRPLLVSVPCVQPLDVGRLFPMLEGMSHVVSVEEHYVGCGLGSLLLDGVVKRRPPWRFHRLGIPDEFIHAINDTAGMRRRFGISAQAIADYVLSLE